MSYSFAEEDAAGRGRRRCRGRRLVLLGPVDGLGLPSVRWRLQPRAVSVLGGCRGRKYRAWIAAQEPMPLPLATDARAPGNSDHGIQHLTFFSTSLLGLLDIEFGSDPGDVIWWCWGSTDWVVWLRVLTWGVVTIWRCLGTVQIHLQLNFSFVWRDNRV
jgi:hypothetical protein